MVTFDLKARLGNYPGAQIQTGYYPKENPADPQQVGWRVIQGGEYIGSPTVNLWSPPTFPAAGCVFIKITPEFQGWLESMEAAGLVERTGRIEGAGFVEQYAAEARVLVPELLEVGS